MEVVGGTGSALRSVVKDCHVGECIGEAEHVGKAARYPLRHMVHGRYGKVLGENGEWVDQYLVVAAVAALEGQGLLLLRTVFPAQEAGPGRDGGRVGAGQCGDCPGGIVLHPDRHTADGYFLCLYLAQVTVSPRRFRP